MQELLNLQKMEMSLVAAPAISVTSCDNNSCNKAVAETVD
jgi:hypothetical protein